LRAPAPTQTQHEAQQRRIVEGRVSVIARRLGVFAASQPFLREERRFGVSGRPKRPRRKLALQRGRERAA